MDFINHNCDPIELKELSLFLIMYADDMVIFSETAEGLQAMLDTLYDHNEKWKLSVNINKIKIVVFWNGGILSDDENWYYNGLQLETVNTFTYLGVVLNFNGKFSVAEKHVAEEGRKAVFALIKNTKPFMFNHYTLFTYLTHILVVYYVMGVKYGAFIKHQILQKFMLIIVSEF